MIHDRLVQVTALVVMLVCTAASGVILPSLIEKADQRALRYTDVSVDGAPPFVALGTAIGALRGLIVDYLWIKVHLMKEKGLFYEVMADSELITKLQPRFAAVWAFHGHNMAYNISVATNTEIERWEWVNAGIRLVRNEGLRYNPNDLQLHRELAFWFAHKIEGVVDDAHLYYKTQFCREWHINLGEPPDDLQERIAWIKKIADAPATLEEAEARTPGVMALVDDLEEVAAPFRSEMEIKLDRSLLRMYVRWQEVRGESAAAQVMNLEEKLQQSALFVGFDALANDPARAAQWDTLIAHIRKRVLENEYNMEPQLMYEYTRDLGPIDWRHGQAHALYWSRRGSQRAEQRVVSEDDVYKILNNDRLQMQAMQGLARWGKIYFDHHSQELPSRMPEPRWIDTIDREFDRIYAKHYNTRGGGPESFIGFFQNFMSSAIREWYRAGERQRAQKLMDRMNSLFGTEQSEAVGQNLKWRQPLDVFVREETFEEYEFQPHLAPSEVAASMRYGFVGGLGGGRPEILRNALQFGDEVIEFFRGNRYNNFVNKFGRARMAEIIHGLEDSAKVVFAQVMMDRSLPLQRRMVIWNEANEISREFQWFAYDRVRPYLQRELADSYYGQQFTIDELLPEPAGLEEYRIAAAERARQRAAETGEQRTRDTIQRR